MTVWKQLKNTPVWSDAQHARVRARLSAHMRQTRRAVGSTFFLRRRLYYSGLAAVVVMFAGGGVVAVAQDSASYERLYPVRLFTETVRTRLTADPVKKTERALAYSQERLVELQGLAHAQAVAEGRGRDAEVIPAELRYAGFQKSTQAIEVFSRIAQAQVEQMREQSDNSAAEVFAQQLDAVLDASLGILVSVEHNAPADEPVRAVAAKTRQRVSPLESLVEQQNNRQREKIMNTMLTFSVPTASSSERDTQDEWEEQKRVALLRARAHAMRRLYETRQSLDKAQSVLREYEARFGQEAVEAWRNRFAMAQNTTKEADMLIARGDYYGGFATASAALTMSSHILVSVPVISSRTLLYMDDNDMVRFYVAPPYQDDFKSTTVAADAAKPEP